LNLSFYLFSGLVGLLVLLLVWSLRRPGGHAGLAHVSEALGESGCCHVTHLAQIRQALAKTDYDFLSQRAPNGVVRRVRRERRDVALGYLSALREDFDGLLRIARVIAVLSPEVKAVQELERLRLTVRFAWRFEMIRLKLTVGFAPLSQVDRLANMISGLSVRIEHAVKEFGERTALASELASALHRGGIDAVQ
jgi:hypothetical protein